MYKLWHEVVPHFPNTSRHTLGTKIDGSIIEIAGLPFTASMLKPEQKLLPLQQAQVKLDHLKFFLQVAWEIKVLDQKKYIALSELIHGIGIMLGGWYKKIEKQNSPIIEGEK